MCKVLVAHPKFQGVAAQVAIAEYLTRNVKSVKQDIKFEDVKKEVVDIEFEDATF